MSQEVRNKIYAVGVAVFGLAVIGGFVDQAQADVALGLFDSVLSTIVIVVGLVTNIIAFIKSLTSKTTTVEVPKDKVLSVNTESGLRTVSGTRVRDDIPPTV